MKFITRNIAIAAAALFSLIGSAPQTQAADIRLDGSGYYEFIGPVKFFGGGVKQGGRYGNLGTDYYHKTSISMRWITNRSTNRTGNLSFEFWGMPFYGATKGIVLMTLPLSQLGGGHSYTNKKSTGYAISLDEYRFPELNIWERTSKGWKFRDALSFKRDNLL